MGAVHRGRIGGAKHARDIMQACRGFDLKLSGLARVSMAERLLRYLEKTIYYL
jgi:hypothetical protein